MSRKVVNIERAKIDRDRALLAMSKKERDAVFHDVAGDIFEGILEEAGADGAQIRLICVALSKDGEPDRLVSVFPEYGDGDHGDFCADTVNDLSPFLQPGESLRVATFNVDIDRLEQFKFPLKKMWRDRENGDKKAFAAWQHYKHLHDARSVPTIIVTWLIGPRRARKAVFFDIDYGDGAGRYEYTADTIEGMRWNRLIPETHRLQPLAYRVPMNALSETENV